MSPILCSSPEKWRTPIYKKARTNKKAEAVLILLCAGFDSVAFSSAKPESELAQLRELFLKLEEDVIDIRRGQECLRADMEMVCDSAELSA